MCVAENALVRSQLSLGMLASLPRDHVVGNLLSLYSSYLALQAQRAPGAYDETIIPALKNISDDKPKEREEQPLPSLFNCGMLQPFELGAQDISSYDEDDEEYNSLGCLCPPRSF